MADTPFNATRIGRLIAEQADIPAGVVNVVPASDHLVGEELTLPPKVFLRGRADRRDAGQFTPVPLS
jgi:acyl-CoA reductase-like NAD-dependent aldehyde dehydrogenase